jgi:hypothetical protein
MEAKIFLLNIWTQKIKANKINSCIAQHLKTKLWLNICVEIFI